VAIAAKVATVLNSREIAISAGSDAGVKSDDIVRLIKHTEITDPDTGELLGRTERTIVRFQVTSAAKRFSIARTFELIGGTPPRTAQVSASPAEAALPHVFLVQPGMEVVVETPLPVPPPTEADLEDLPF
jgi:hypothetical protein